ncbi:MAG: hypothetical protein QM820_63730 [Minicystis sp.]
MPRLAVLWPCLPLVALLLPACGATAPPPEVPPVPAVPPAAEAPCPKSVESPETAVERLTAALADRSADPAQRAVAVHALGCLVAMTKRPEHGPVLAVLTLGWTEIISRMLEELVVPPARLPPIVDAFGQAFCDASPEVRATAERELRAMRAPVAGLALGRAVRSCDGPRAVAAVEVLEARIVEFLRQQRKKGADGDKAWTGLVAFGPPLEAAAGSEKAEVRGRAQAALARAGGVLDPLVLARAQDPDADTLSQATAEMKLPLFAAALARATPAFRARLGDPDYRIRLAAARTVWRLEGTGAAALDRLSNDLWAGVHVPVSVDPATGAELRAMMGKIDAPPPFFGVDLRDEIERVARLGPDAHFAVDPIRACLAVPEKKLGALGVHKTAAAALAFIAGDRAGLPLLRKDFDAHMHSFGIIAELTAQAVLHLEPDDAEARRALGLEPGPLLTVLTRRAIRGERLEWWIKILLQRETKRSPPPARGP